MQHDKELAQQLQLGSWKDYDYINQSGCGRIDGVDDSKRFDALRLALSVLQVSPENTEAIFSVIAAVLWLGNLKFSVSSAAFTYLHTKTSRIDSKC